MEQRRVTVKVEFQTHERLEKFADRNLPRKGSLSDAIKLLLDLAENRGRSK